MKNNINCTENNKIYGITRTNKSAYISRPAWNETHTVERTAIRHAKIAKRKEAIDTAKWCIITFLMGLAVVFAPMLNYFI